jgi:hypothetical protein
LEAGHRETQVTQDTEALLTYVDVETLELLDGAGWDVGRMFRLLVESVNGVGNAVTGDGPTPCDPPEFADDKYLVSLMKHLHEQGHLTFGEEQIVSDLTASVAFDSADAQALLSAHKEGYGVREAEQGYVLTRTDEVRSLRFSPEADPRDLGEILRILRLPTGLAFYPIQWAEGGQLRSLDPTEQRTKVTISTRFPLEAMYFLSHAIAVPPEHGEQGLVTVTRNPDGSVFDWGMVTGDLLRVCVSKKKPKSAAVAVRYRNHWFYISDADAASKNTLALFRELMRLQKGGCTSDKPLLTLPVGGRR